MSDTAWHITYTRPNGGLLLFNITAPHPDGALTDALWYILILLGDPYQPGTTEPHINITPTPPPITRKAPRR